MQYQTTFNNNQCEYGERHIHTGHGRPIQLSEPQRDRMYLAPSTLRHLNPSLQLASATPLGALLLPDGPVPCDRNGAVSFSRGPLGHRANGHMCLSFIL